MREMEEKMSIRNEKFGVTKEGKEITKYILENNNGLRVALLDLGAVIAETWVPDKNGVLEDVTLGYDTLEKYVTNKPGFGAVIGRCANRISNASFTLNGKKYTLEQNDVTNCLHGGNFRYERQFYEAECQSEEGQDSISFSRLSPDMEQGFPGNATVVITYTLNDENELMIEYYLVSDQDTVVNMTNHNYFNIGVGGHKATSLLNQEMQVFADNYTPVDEILIPTGEIRSVEGTALDFREMHKLGEGIGEASPDDKTVIGYDHNFVLRKDEGGIEKAVVYQDRESGRRLEVYTDFPGLQIYSATMLEEPDGKDGTEYKRFSGICFETQNFPNAVNQPGFPSAVLKAGEEYERVAVFRFDVMEEE